MATQDIRTAMQSLSSEVETPSVSTPQETPKADNVESTAQAESNADPQEEAEPDEESFGDHAEYKTALKEWTRKQTEKDLRAEHKKQIDGYYSDLRKAREQKRKLNETVSELQARLKPNEPIQKPDVNQYSDPEKYATDMVAYDRATRQAESQKVNDLRQRESAEIHQVETIWENNEKESGVKDVEGVLDHVKKTGMLDSFSMEDRKSLFVSPVGANMLEFLAMNPEITEAIADSEHPTMELKALERDLMRAIYKQNGGIAPAQSVATMVAPKPAPVKPSLVPPSTPKGGSSATGSGRSLQNASSMEEYMRTRNSQNKRK